MYIFRLLYYFVQFGSHTSCTPSWSLISHAHHADFCQVPKTFYKNANSLSSKSQKNSKNHAWLLKKKLVALVLAACRNQNFGRPIMHHAACRIEWNSTVNIIFLSCYICHYIGHGYSRVMGFAWVPKYGPGPIPMRTLPTYPAGTLYLLSNTTWNWKV